MYTPKNQTTIGFLCTLGAFMAWGSLPLYWGLLFHMPAITILCHRVIWSWIFVFTLITITGQWHIIHKLLSDRRMLFYVFICGCLINLNWGLYIYAISTGHVVEASMGYYMNPLMSAFAGAVFFSERMRNFQKAALLLTLSGVAYMIIGYGEIPYFAVALAASFAIYGAIHKLIKIGVLDSMFYEMSVSLIPASAYLLLFNTAPAFFSQSPSMMALIALSGPLTALPLMGFAAGVKRLNLTTTGIIQYVSPTLTFIIGVLYFKEPVNKELLIVFAFVWAGVALYLIDGLAHQHMYRKNLKIKA